MERRVRVSIDMSPEEFDDLKRLKKISDTLSHAGAIRKSIKLSFKIYAMLEGKGKIQHVNEKGEVETLVFL